MRNEELLECPFCGGEARVMHEKKECRVLLLYGITCFYCKAGTGIEFLTQEYAIKAWNTRPTATKPVSLEGILEMVEICPLCDLTGEVRRDCSDELEECPSCNGKLIVPTDKAILNYLEGK